MALKAIVLILLAIFCHVLCSQEPQMQCEFCKDWTICMRVRCAPPPDPCPEEKPYLLYGECGCCQFCSEIPRKGPCGVCGVDLVCKEPYPICGVNQTVSIDYCGCCRTCKTIVGLGEICGSECEPSFSVCEVGLQCLGGTCREPANE